MEILSHAQDTLAPRAHGRTCPTTYATPGAAAWTCKEEPQVQGARAGSPSSFEPPAGLEVNDHRRRRASTFPQGWGLVRASNTQPALVVRTEATGPQQRDAYLARLRQAIERHTQALG